MVTLKDSMTKENLLKAINELLNFPAKRETMINNASKLMVNNPAKFLADKMADLGCKIAVNNDGGGSTNFWFKKDTSSSWKHMVGSGSRGKMDSIVYWTEL